MGEDRPCTDDNFGDLFTKVACWVLTSPLPAPGDDTSAKKAPSADPDVGNCSLFRSSLRKLGQLCENGAHRFRRLIQVSRSAGAPCSSYRLDRGAIPIPATAYGGFAKAADQALERLNIPLSGQLYRLHSDWSNMGARHLQRQTSEERVCQPRRSRGWALSFHNNRGDAAF